jgi:thiol-disulfide isomerase/thioredoxin
MSPVCTLLVVLFATASGGTGLIEPKDGSDEARPPVSRAVHRFVATDLDGQRWTTADLRGRVILLDFWATWCAPCLAEMPRLKSLRSKHSRDDFEIVGISLDVTSRQAFVSWLNRNRIEWPQVHERAAYSGKVPRLFGIDRLPRTVLIDRDGSVAAVDVRGDRLAALVDELVAGGAAGPLSVRSKR